MKMKNHKPKILLPLVALNVALLLSTSVYAASAQDMELSQFQESINKVQQQQQPASPQAIVEGQANQATQAVNPIEKQPPLPQSSVPKIVVRQPTVTQLMQEQPTFDQKQAYSSMLQQAMPMTPSQIIDLKRRMAAAQRASAASAEAPPQPVTSSRIVDLAPGSTPPVIRLEQGFITTLDFVDSAGAPWAIHTIDNGNPGAFNVSWDKAGNVLMIQALKPYTYGNLAVTLKGSDTPIMLTLVPGQRVVDYRTDLRIPGLAPGSANQYEKMSDLPQSASQKLLQVLDGVAPEHAKQLQVDGGDGQAWLLGNKLYFRSKFAVLSPGWIGHMKSPDGTNAYEIQKTPTILVSEFGKPVEVKVEGV